MITPGWLKGAPPFPSGGLTVSVEYRSGRQEAYLHLPVLNPVLAGMLDCAGGSLFPGSMNLWAENGLVLPEPWQVPVGPDVWHFVPIVLDEKAVGIVARRADSGPGPFLEVFACVRIASLLRVAPGAHMTARLLSGRLLEFAA